LYASPLKSSAFALPCIGEHSITFGTAIVPLICRGFDGESFGMAFGPNGNLYASYYSGSGGLSGPTDLVFGPNGNLFVISSGNASVLEYNGTTGAFVKVFVTSASGGLNEPWGLVFRPGGTNSVNESLVFVQ
jgi:hypothetical protein